MKRHQLKEIWQNCLDSDLELLSALLVMAVCHDSRVSRI